MKANAELVKKTIRTQTVNALSAEDINTGEKCGYYTGTPEELCEAVDELESYMLSPYRLKAWDTAVDRKRGGRPVDQKPFVWVLMGQSAPKPAAPAPAPAPAPTAPAVLNGVAADTIKEAATEKARADYLDREMAALREELAALRAELDEADEEAEELMNKAIHPPLKWYETEAGMRAVLDTVKPLSEAAAKFMVGKMTPPQRDRAIGPTEAAADVTPGEKELIVAWRNYERQNPEESELVKGQLTQYLPGNESNQDHGQAATS